LNVFPEDVERVLDRQSGVRESAVVGHDRVQAALVIEPGADIDQIVRAANAGLEEHQRIRDVAIWPGEALPRTEGTGKLKRVEVARWIENGARPPAEHAGDGLESIVARFTRNRSVRPDTTLDELGLSSLERVELMMAIEQKFGASVDENQFTAARTVADLRAAATSGATVRPEPIVFPSWNRSGVAKLARSLSLATWILPIARIFAWVRPAGREHLRTLEGPVIFAANHQSHLDTLAILLALPSRWRYKIAPAMAKEFFKAHFFPAQHGRAAWLTNSLNYYLSTLFFNAFPFPQRETGLREALRYAGDLVSQGCSILIFPEGRRSETGSIDVFRPGVGILASKLEIPVVPVRIEGADGVLKVGWNMARPGRVVVKFGEPMMLRGEDYARLATRVEEAVRGL
jgi:long-chain acyl-CoA synthetase